MLAAAMQTLDAPSQMRILAVCGSLQSQSKNLALLGTAARCVPPAVELVLFDGLGDLPHFNPDIEATATPDSVLRWRQALASSDAVLIACPEYGFSLPGVLKNAIDWVIGSGELEGKIVAITAAVPGPARGPEFERLVAALVESLVQAVHTQKTTKPFPRNDPSA